VVTAILLTALALPVVLFWQLRSRARLKGAAAAAIAIAAGWMLNLAWAFAVEATTIRAPSQDGDDTLAIAALFGWVCPLVLVLLTWLVWRFTARRAA